MSAEKQSASSSQNIGRDFEKAMAHLLPKLFHAFGYTATVRQQTSGTQHGFDLLLQATPNHRPQAKPLHLYVECKGTGTNSSPIALRELKDKCDDLHWANFSTKNALIFCGALRHPKHDNRWPNGLASLQDKYPFALVDWMAESQEQPGLIYSALMAYAPEGAEDPVAHYCKTHLQSHSPSPNATRFNEVAVRLGDELNQRLRQHLKNQQDNNGSCRIIQPDDWQLALDAVTPTDQDSEAQQKRKQKNQAKLLNYYLRLNTEAKVLRQVVASRYHVVDEATKTKFDQKLEDLLQQEPDYSLIYFSHIGGAGKSTLLQELAWHYTGTYTVVELYKPTKDDAIRLVNWLQLTQNESELPVLLLADNWAEQAEYLLGFLEALKHHGEDLLMPFVLIAAERATRIKQMEEEGMLALFFSNVEEHYCIRPHMAKAQRKALFDKFYQALTQQFAQEAATLTEHRQQAWNSFKSIDEQPAKGHYRLSIAEGFLHVIDFLKGLNLLKSYTFDWEDWVTDAKKAGNHLEQVYMAVATFYQFGAAPSVDSIDQSLQSVNAIALDQALAKDQDMPIQRRIQNGTPVLQLRHELLGTWYFRKTEDYAAAQRFTRAWQDYAQKTINAMQGMPSPEAQYTKSVVVQLHRHPEIKKDEHFKGLWAGANVLNILATYIEKHPEERVARTELMKAYYQRNQSNEAIALGNDTIALPSFTKEEHPRVELAKALQQRAGAGDLPAARKHLLAALAAKPRALHARTELAKVYQAMGSPQDLKNAEKALLEYIHLDPSGLHPRTELAKVYQAMGSPQDLKNAEKALLELLNIDQNNLQARTELAKVYQAMGSPQDLKNAEKALLEYIHLDPSGLHPRTELAKVYQAMGSPQDLKNAEKALLELLNIDQNNLQARTELAKVYQAMGSPQDLKNAEKALLELLNIDQNNLQARTELAKVYQAMGSPQDLKNAEKALLKILELSPKDLQSRTELAKVYQAMGSPQDLKNAEKALLELLNIDQNNLQARTELAKVYQAMGSPQDLKNAEKALLEYIHLDPSGLHPRTELAKVYQAMGSPQDLKNAEKALLKILELSPKDLQSRTELAKVYQAMGSPQDLKNAEKALLEYIHLDPSGLHPRTELAKVYQAMGSPQDLKNAEAAYLELLGLAKNNLFGLDNLVRLYMRMGRDHLAKALPYLHRALAAKPNNSHSLRNGYHLYRKLKQLHRAGKFAEALTQLPHRHKETQHWEQWQRQTQGYTLYQTGTVSARNNWPDQVTTPNGETIAAEKAPKVRQHSYGLHTGQQVFFALGPNGKANFVEPYFADWRGAGGTANN